MNRVEKGRLGKVILLFVVVGFAVATNSWGSEDRPDVADEEAVTKAVRGMYAALSKQDWQAFPSSFVEDATISRVLVKGPSSTLVQTYSVDEFIELHQRIFEDGTTFRQQMVSAEVQISNHVAQVWSRFEIHTASEGAKFSGFDAFALYKVGGQWKVVSVATQRGGS